MPKKASPEPVLRTRADYKAAINEMLAEMDRIHVEIHSHDEEIERLGVETRDILAKIRASRNREGRDMVLAEKLYTAEDLERISAQGRRYELVKGELREMPPTGDAHGNATFKSTTRMGYYILTHKLGKGRGAETGFLLSRNPDTVLAPDFAFIAAGRTIGPPIEGFLPIVPDLIVEVRSPNDRTKEVVAKMEQWRAAGVRMGLELDPRRRILTVYRPGMEPKTLSADDTFSGEDVLPGFSTLVREFFSED